MFFDNLVILFHRIDLTLTDMTNYTLNPELPILIIINNRSILYHMVFMLATYIFIILHFFLSLDIKNKQLINPLVTMNIENITSHILSLSCLKRFYMLLTLESPKLKSLIMLQ